MSNCLRMNTKFFSVNNNVQCTCHSSLKIAPEDLFANIFWFWRIYFPIFFSSGWFTSQYFLVLKDFIRYFLFWRIYFPIFFCSERFTSQYVSVPEQFTFQYFSLLMDKLPNIFLFWRIYSLIFSSKEFTSQYFSVSKI